jgi:predicted nucleotidyltransferase
MAVNTIIKQKTQCQRYIIYFPNTKYLMITKIDIPMEQIQEFCQKWQITEFALFGSVLREDFRLDSDIDILITFSRTAKRGLM